MYSKCDSRSKIRSSWIFLTILLAFDVALFLQMTSVAQAVAVNVTAPGNSTMPNRPNATTSTTTVSSSSNPSKYGESVTLTATVTAGATGVVTFTIDSTVVTRTLSGSKATVVINTLSVGTHTVAVDYGGDGSFDPSSGTLSGGQQVNKANTTATITNSGALGTASVVGQSYAVNYAVTVNSPGSGSPSGNVVVSDGTDSCTGTVAAGTCNLTSTTSGSKTITATYQGDGSNYNASPASSGVGHTVNKANTTTALATSGTPSVYGQTVSFTATVTVNSPGSGMPSGTVQFYADGSTLGSTATLVSGSASVNTSSLSAATHTITATYSGDTKFNTSNGTLSGGQVVVSQMNQTITVVTHAPVTSAVGSSFVVSATASSGLPVTFTSSGGCTNVGTRYTMTSATTACTVKYDQAGSSYYYAATEVSESVTAQKAMIQLPLILRNYPPTAPKPGYWASTTGESFFVNADSTIVTFFAVKFNVLSCGLTGQTITESNIPIDNNGFAFSDSAHFNGGTFAANVTFTGLQTQTNANGYDQLTNYNLPGCPNVYWSPFPFTATWQSANPPAAPSRGPFRNVIPSN